MSAATILTTAALRGIDLLAPTADDYRDLAWVAEHLAKEKRFNGATPECEYSVAEHCARGYDAILKATGDAALAGEFLVHDGPEAALKDDTTPKKCAIAELVEARCGVLAERILACFAELTERHDAALHAAVGLAWPPSPEIAKAVKYWDRVMFVTEWRDLMTGAEHPDWAPYRDLVALPERIEPWRWTVARTAWLRRAAALLPGARAGTRD